MISDNIVVQSVGISRNTGVLILAGSVDELSHVTTSMTVNPTSNVSYEELTFSIQQSLMSAYTNSQFIASSTVPGLSLTSNVVTVTTISPHGFSVGQVVTIVGTGNPVFEGTFIITGVPTATTFTFSQTGSDATSGNGYITLVQGAQTVAPSVDLSVIIGGVDISDNIADTLSINWQDNGNGSCTLSVLGYKPFQTLPTTTAINPGASILVLANISVNNLSYNFTVFTGFVADIHYKSNLLSVNCVDMSYPISLPSSKLNRQFGQTRKSNLLQLIANIAGISHIVNERTGQIEDEVMILKTTANEEFPLDFMKKVSVPQTWKLGFTPTGDLQVYREQLKNVPDYIITDDLILNGSLEFSKNIDNVINAQEVTGVSYPIDQKIEDPKIDPCKSKKSSCPQTDLWGECVPGGAILFGTGAGPALTDKQDACKFGTRDICIEDPNTKPDNTPTDPCNPNPPASQLTIAGG